MPSVRVVIGANYGDEGKGLATDYFVNEYLSKNQSCIVVCTNGGAQRGHTVFANNIRHVFHHIGSGSISGADTYLPEYYITNPLIFREEYEELSQKIHIPRIYVNPNCRVSTPYDMIINQIVEDSRNNKHGSCGVGIWETVRRYNESDSLFLKDMFNLSFNDFREYMINIRCMYLYDVLSDYGIRNISDEWSNIINSDTLIEHFYDDIQFMKNHVYLSNDDILDNYNGIVYENAQGLLLDEKYGIHSTPSETGMKSVMRTLIGLLNVSDIEICYVTRSYITRHGNGPLKNECDKNYINRNIIDRTNVPNKYQGTLRYAKYSKYSWKNMKDRCRDDSSIIWKYFNSSTKISIYLMVTHCNEYSNSYLTNDPCIKYKSYSESSDEVHDVGISYKVKYTQEYGYNLMEVFL